LNQSRVTGIHTNKQTSSSPTFKNSKASSVISLITGKNIIATVQIEANNHRRTAIIPVLVSPIGTLFETERYQRDPPRPQ
jgi:hypothetical protein